MTAIPDDELPRTGHQHVDAALERLRGMGELPVDEHAQVYHAVHDELRQTLERAGSDHSDGTENEAGAAQ